jgi:hypothetical protein
MNFSKINDAVNSFLSGVPDTLLSIVLVCFAAFAIYVALRGTPVMKIGVILWFLLP